MKILAIETATENCSVALLNDSNISEKSALAPREHAYLVLPYVEALLEDANLKLSDLDYFAFGQGPGAFTGLRIAAGMVQGLALANNTPVIPVSSLLALAAEAKERFGNTKVISVLDARMKELYWAKYDFKDEDAIFKVEEQLDSPEKTFAAIEDDLAAWQLAGPGCEHVKPYIRDNGVLEKLEEKVSLYPNARQIAQLAKLQIEKGYSDFGIATPKYVRNKVAEKSQKTGI